MSDSISTFGATSAAVDADVRPIKREIKAMRDERKLREWVLEHDDALTPISTALLNSWVQIEGVRFYRHAGIVGITAKEPITRTINGTRSEVDALKASVVAQRERIDKLEQQLAATVKALKERDTMLVTRFETIEEALTDHVKAFGGLEPSVSQLSVALDEVRGTIRDIVAAMADRE
jgi:tetrahydromethanopterin S-methyltransferase subunit B